MIKNYRLLLLLLNLLSLKTVNAMEKEKVNEQNISLKLFHAIKSNNKALALEIINMKENKDLDINFESDRGNTALMLAAIYMPEVIAKLVSKQANVNHINKQNNCALTACALNNKESSIEQLLKFNPDLNILNNQENSAIDIALENKNEKIIKLLLFHNVDFNYENENGENLLVLAFKKDFDSIAKQLIKNKIIKNKKAITEFLQNQKIFDDLKKMLLSNINVDAYNKKGETQLTFATKKNNYELAHDLLRHGAKLKLKNQVAKNPFEISLENKNVELIRLYLVYNFDVNSKDNGNTALMLAANFDYKNLLKMLCKNLGISVNKVEKALCATPEAICKTTFVISYLLIQQKINIDEQNKDGITALHIALTRNNSQIAKLLIKSNANVNLINKLSLSPILIAVHLKQHELIDLLLKNKADVHFQDNNSHNALAHAYLSKDIEIFKKILNAGANPNSITAIDKDTLLIRAVDDRELDLINLLLNYKADLNLTNQKGETALFYACYKQNKGIAKILLEHGAKPNIQDNLGNTPLMYASVLGDLDLVKLLLEYKANFNLINKRNDKAIGLAGKNSHKEVVSFLLKIAHD